jgi:hypothetical protein
MLIPDGDLTTETELFDDVAGSLEGHDLPPALSSPILLRFLGQIVRDGTGMVKLAAVSG